MTPRFDLHRLAAAAGIVLAAAVTPALAADVTITPPSGGGVVINGPVTMPGVPGSTGQSDVFVCAATTGELGPCSAPTGPTGATGATGVTGPTGATGATGDAGATGATGPAGDPGATGATGPQGLVGPMGPQGPAGAQGPEGPMGPMGPQGPAGGGLVLVMGNSNGQSLATNNTRYVGVAQPPSTNQATVAFPIPVGGTLSNLQVRLSGSPNNGSGTQTYTFTLMRNGAQIGAIACSIQETADSCSSAGTLSVTAGQTLSLRSAPSRSGGMGTNWPTARSVTWSFAITP